MKCRLLSTVRRAAMLCLFAIVIWYLGRANAEDRPPKETKAILAKVVRAVASNQAQLKDVRAEILVVVENHLVEKPTQKIFHHKDGTTDATYALPRTTYRERIAISGDQLRYELTGRSEFEDLNPDEAWLIKPGEWQLYQAGIHRLQVWSRPEQLPGRHPIDPRDYGAPLISVPLQKWLESLEARSAQVVRQDDGTTLARLQLAKNENRLLIECRSGDGLLPSFDVVQNWRLFEHRNSVSARARQKGMVPQEDDLEVFPKGPERPPEQ